MNLDSSVKSPHQKPNFIIKSTIKRVLPQTNYLKPVFLNLNYQCFWICGLISLGTLFPPRFRKTCQWFQVHFLWKNSLDGTFDDEVGFLMRRFDTTVGVHKQRWACVDIQSTLSKCIHMCGWNLYALRGIFT